ncbi:GPW/gp25 family protein [Gynuella sp.]|uniref:GPW/gp25 family protein n=1 Tax=Gynuella sp. TaxID=2969146 RepID=UPI003D099612
MSVGRLLFERLGREPGVSVKESVSRSIQQLTTTQHVRDGQLVPGILNFGMPSICDLGIGGGDLRQFAALLKERIQQFEPRIKDVDVVIERGRLVVVGTLPDSDEPTRWWL